jgi:hypothetical protein
VSRRIVVLSGELTTLSAAAPVERAERMLVEDFPLTGLDPAWQKARAQSRPCVTDPSW